MRHAAMRSSCCSASPSSWGITNLSFSLPSITSITLHLFLECIGVPRTKLNNHFSRPLSSKNNNRKLYCCFLVAHHATKIYHRVMSIVSLITTDVVHMNKIHCFVVEHIWYICMWWEITSKQYKTMNFVLHTYILAFNRRGGSHPPANNIVSDTFCIAVYPTWWITSFLSYYLP